MKRNHSRLNILDKGRKRQLSTYVILSRKYHTLGFMQLQQSVTGVRGAPQLSRRESKAFRDKLNVFEFQPFT